MRSIRPWPGNSPTGPSATPGPPGVSRLRTMRATPPATGVPGPPGEPAGEADQDQRNRGQGTHHSQEVRQSQIDRGQEARRGQETRQSQETPQSQTDRGQEARQDQTDRASSRSPATTDMGHPADTAGGGYIPAVTATSLSTLSRSRSLTATTGTNQPATSPATPSATWSRSAMQNAPGHRAAGRPGAATSNMRFPGIRAAGRVAVTAGPVVVIITTRSKLTAGNLSKTSPGTTRGPHRPAGATPPDPRSTRSKTEPGALGSFVPPLSFRRGGRAARE